MVILYCDGMDYVVLVKGVVECMFDLCGIEMGVDGVLWLLDCVIVLCVIEMLIFWGLWVLVIGMGVGVGIFDDFDENVILGLLVLIGL